MTSLLQFIRDGGIIMIPLLLLSLGAVAIIVERWLVFRTLGSLAPALLPEVLGLARQSRCDEALQLCAAAPGPLAAALATILRHRDRPVEVAERQVEEIGQDFFLRLERHLPFLDTVTTIAPLLGLLGTVIGMIGTFNALGVQQAGQGNSDAVLAGVGEALYATATGILIAVVSFVAYNGFAARLRTITGETEQGATKLINALIEARAGHFPLREREEDDAIQTAPNA